MRLPFPSVGATENVLMAAVLGPGKTIVTILADYGTRYQSKLFNPKFQREKKLPVPDWMGRKMEVPNVME